MQHLPKEQRRNVAAMSMYMTWNVWKERNMSTFEGTTATPMYVFGFIKEVRAVMQHRSEDREYVRYL